MSSTPATPASLIASDSAGDSPASWNLNSSGISQSVYSGVSSATMGSSVHTSQDTNIGIAIEAINNIDHTRDLQPIFRALEAKVKPIMEVEVEKYGWTKSSSYAKACSTCNTKQGFFNFIFLDSLS